jgi:hypothetical protein
VLGDDIIIADKNVAKCYTDVCNEYGITIGFPKSFVSTDGFFQFASQNIKGDVNLSPISVKEALSASGVSYYYGADFNLSRKVEFTQRLIGKGFIGSSNLLNLVRSNSTYAQWKRYAAQLTKGIFPLEMSNLLTALLSRDFKLLDKSISVDQLMASVRGDIRLFTNNLPEDPKGVRTYLKLFYEQLNRQVLKLLKDIQSCLILKPLQGQSKTLTDLLYTPSAMGLNSQTLDSYMKLIQRY